MIHREIPDWNTYFMRMLPAIAARSKDPNTQVGCIITGQDHSIRSTGYNSFPRGINDNVPERYQPPLKYLVTCHGERNAIFAAAKIGTPLEGCIIYQSFLPCTDCAQAIIQVGIIEIVYDITQQERYESERTKYKDHFNITRQLLSEAKVLVTTWS